MDIEVLDVRPKGNGLEAFVKAWQHGRPIGFGDGTVEVERFLLNNQPALIPHPGGNIWRVCQGRGGPRLYRYHAHAEAALLLSLRQSLHVVRKFDDRRIVKGKVGNTVSTFRPAAGNVDPVDGTVFRAGVGEVFGDICTGAGTGADTTATPNDCASMQASTVTDRFTSLFRGIFLFDTSSILVTDALSAAVLTLTGDVKGNGLGSHGVVITGSAPAIDSNLDGSDFETISKTAFCSAVAYGSLATSGGTTDFTFNGTGIAAIALGSGRTKLASMMDWDQAESFGGSWVLGDASYWLVHMADESGTTQDPLLTVTHTSSGADDADYYNRLTNFGDA